MQEVLVYSELFLKKVGKSRKISYDFQNRTSTINVRESFDHIINLRFSI